MVGRRAGFRPSSYTSFPRVAGRRSRNQPVQDLAEDKQCREKLCRYQHSDQFQDSAVVSKDNETFYLPLPTAGRETLEQANARHAAYLDQLQKEAEAKKKVAQDEKEAAQSGADKKEAVQAQEKAVSREEGEAQAAGNEAQREESPVCNSVVNNLMGESPVESAQEEDGQKIAE